MFLERVNVPSKVQRNFKSQSVKLVNFKNNKIPEFKRALSDIDPEYNSEPIFISERLFKRESMKKIFPRRSARIEFGIEDIIMDEIDNINENFQEKEMKTEEVKGNDLSEENLSKQKVIFKYMTKLK